MVQKVSMRGRTHPRRYQLRLVFLPLDKQESYAPSCADCAGAPMMKWGVVYRGEKRIIRPRFFCPVCRLKDF